MDENDGFTLMELMVVLAVVAVLVAIAAPNLRTWVDTGRLNSGAREVQSVLNLARSAAVKEHFNVVVRFTIGAGTAGTYVAFVDNGAVAGTQEAGEEVVATGTMPEGVNLYFAAFAGGWGSATRFSPMGLPAGFAGEVRVRDRFGTHFRRMMVSAAGNIRMLKSSDGNNWWE